MTSENKEKRKRALNWEIDEKKLLREILTEYVSVIENKCTDTNSNKRKLEAWQIVHERFNELNIRPRTLVELKQQWRICKLYAKKKINEYRLAKDKNGGGSGPQSPDDDTINLAKQLPLEFEVDNNEDSDASLSIASIIAENAAVRNQTVLQCLQQEYDLKLRHMTKMHEMQICHLAESHEWARQEHRLRVQVLEQQLINKNEKP